MSGEYSLGYLVGRPKPLLDWEQVRLPARDMDGLRRFIGQRRREVRQVIKAPEWHCSVCGWRGEFSVEPGIATRDNHRCGHCRSMQRQRDVAQIIVDEYGRGAALDLNRLVASGFLNGLSIYEVGIRGPIMSRLSKLPGYFKSYFWEDVPLGECKDGVQCQDLRQLTYGADSIDLIISLDVFEHVFEPEKALSEIARVLRPGGMHVFSIPVYYPIPEASTIRAELVDGEIRYLTEPRYHVAGDDSKSLLVTDWGQDLIDLHDRAGLRLSVVRRSAPSVEGLRNATMVARKI